MTEKTFCSDRFDVFAQCHDNIIIITSILPAYGSSLTLFPAQFITVIVLVKGR